MDPIVWLYPAVGAQRVLYVLHLMEMRREGTEEKHKLVMSHEHLVQHIVAEIKNNLVSEVLECEMTPFPKHVPVQ